ncbi:hypothetical protein GCM10027020_38750 [Nocardioides salsibiostraticola]
MNRLVLPFLVAFLVSGCGRPTPEPSPSPRAPDIVEEAAAPPTAEVEPAGSTRLRALPRGEAPAIPYVHDSVIQHPNGGTVRMPRLPNGAAAVTVTPYARGLMITDDRIFEGTRGLYLLESGRLHQIDGCTAGGEVSDDGRYVAWVTSACPESGQRAPTKVHVRGPDGTRGQIVTVEPATLLSVWGFDGTDVIFGPLFTPTGQRRRLWSTDLCSPPVRVAADAVPTADRTSISPDGRHTVAVGRWRREIRIRAAQTGDLITRLTLPETVRAGELRWESNTTILAQASAGFNGRTGALVRGDLQGDLERATPVVRGAGFPHEFVFVGRR